MNTELQTFNEPGFLVYRRDQVPPFGSIGSEGILARLHIADGKTTVIGVIPTSNLHEDVQLLLPTNTHIAFLEVPESKDHFTRAKETYARFEFARRLELKYRGQQK